MNGRSAFAHPAIITAFVVVTAIALAAVITRDPDSGRNSKPSAAKKAPTRPQLNGVYSRLGSPPAGWYWLGPRGRDTRVFRDLGYPDQDAVTYIYDYRNQRTSIERGKLARDTVTVLTDKPPAAQARELRRTLPRGRRLPTSLGPRAYVDPALSTAHIFLSSGQVVTVYSRKVERMRPALLQLARTR